MIPDEKGVLIRYNHPSAAGRGIGSALAGLAGREAAPFTMIGIMLDLSRNLVFTVSALRKLFQRLAFLGYNTVFLYCEDTYELPGEPCFGALRGRYTAEEIMILPPLSALNGSAVSRLWDTCLRFYAGQPPTAASGIPQAS